MVVDCGDLPSGVAVDLGGTKIAATRVLEGKISHVVRAKTDSESGAKQQVDAIIALLDKLNLQSHEAVGVALAGRVSADGVWHAVNTDTLKDVNEVPIGALLSERLQRNVIVENDAIAAAYGEYIAGAGKGIRAFGFITVSTGVGGGIVLNRQPLRSRRGMAGHVGFTTSRLATEICGSGRAQTVESIAGGRAIAALAERKGYLGLDAKAVYKRHLVGESWATGLIEQSACVVAELCANLVAVLDLERIALGGSIGLAEGYLEMVNAELKKEPELFQPNVVRTALGADSAHIGILALSSYI